MAKTPTPSSAGSAPSSRPANGSPSRPTSAAGACSISSDPVLPDPVLSALAALELDRLLLAHPLRRRPTLHWRSWPTTAGRADFGRWEILLSSRVLDTPERVVATLIHEYAHLLAFDRHVRRGTGHGPAWRTAMAELGAVPTVRHDYPVRRNIPRQRAIYRCLGCGVEIPRARRLASGRRWVHASCGGGLRLVRVEAREN